jgi:BolA family transcriptional regulator, general stress-responsive regulator
MTVATQLRRAIEHGLSPIRLEIVDESAQHHGHAGSRPEGETHFAVVVVSSAFAGRSRLERQRLIHAAAADLLRGRIHALSIRALTPEEDAAAS